jgi:esterase/lipase superfamily enzyme
MTDPQIFKLSVRRKDTDQGGDVEPEVRDLDNLKGSMARYILLLVHGFNNSRQDAEQSYGKFLNNILPGLRRSKVAPDAIAEFQWPGDVSMGFWPRAIDYPIDIRQALLAAQRLATFLATLPIPGRGATSVRITFVGHSLGCRLILEALGNLLPARNAPGVETIGLMAAAAPVDLVRRGARLFATANPPRQAIKFCSEADSVLQFAFPLGQFLARQYQIEPQNYLEAIGRFGNPDEYGSRLPRPNNSHGSYWNDQVVADVMLAHIDPTQRQSAPAAEIGARALPPGAPLATRNLSQRDLPAQRRV